MEILRDQDGAAVPAVYERIELFISYEDLSEADRTHIYAPGLDETKKLEADEAIVSFELLCRGNYQIDQLYTDKFRELIREYAKGQIDVLLNDPQFMADYEAAQEQISPENFYEENLRPYGKYYDANPYGTAGIELDKDAQRAVFDLFAQSASQFAFYDRKDGQEKIVTKKLVGIFFSSPNNWETVISLSDLMTPRELIIKRLEAAASCSMVTALYNPVSRKRKELFPLALEIFRKYNDGNLPVAAVNNIGREGEELYIGSIDDFPQEKVGMTTLVIIGNSDTVVHNGRFYCRRGYRSDSK